MSTFGRTKTWTDSEILTASDLNAEFDNIVTNANGNNLDGDNISLSASYAWTGTHSFAQPVAFAGLYNSPLRLGGATGVYLWYDAANTCLRVKYGSAPASATDGRILMEG